MANYCLQIKPSAAKDLEALPKKDRQRMAARVQALATDPRPQGSENYLARTSTACATAITGFSTPSTTPRLLVVVYKIGHRREIYR